MAKRSLARQFHTAVMAYFPMIKLDEESGIIKAKWEGVYYHGGRRTDNQSS